MVLPLVAAPNAHALTAQQLNGTFSSPVQVAFPPADSRPFVVQRGGTIRLYDGATNPTFLDLNDPVTKVAAGGEQGLLSIAFAPNYATSGYFFVAYTGVANSGANPPNGAGALVVSRFSVSADPNVANGNSEQRLLVVEHPGQTNHNAGQLQFGPDGYLYVTTGDGGGVGDPDGNAQNLNSRLGKVLRIDPLGNTTTTPFFSVPPDNPFVGGDTIDDLTWSYGLRNPWRYTFDRATGNLVIADVGQGEREEIDFAPRSAGAGAGVNFGWDCREGLIAFANPAPSCAGVSNLTDPVFDYPHGDPTPANPSDNAFGCAVIGGYVYRGSAIPGLQGRYLYTDNCNGDVRSQLLCLPASVDDRSEGVLLAGPAGFGEDPLGELYVASVSAGAVYKLTGSAASSTATCASPPPPPLSPPAPQLPASAPPAGTAAGFNLRAAIRRCKKRHRGVNRRRCIRRAKRRASARLRAKPSG